MRCAHVHHSKGQCLRSDVPHSLHVYRSSRTRRNGRKAVIELARGRCQAQDLWRHDCAGQLEVHHLLRRSQGGTDDLDNLLVVCAHAHRWAHDHPAEAVRLGLLRRTGT